MTYDIVTCVQLFIFWRHLITRLPGDGEEDVRGGLPPCDVVRRAGGSHGQEQQRQIVLARQLLHGGNVAAEEMIFELLARILSFSLNNPYFTGI